MNRRRAPLFLLLFFSAGAPLANAQVTPPYCPVNCEQGPPTGGLAYCNAPGMALKKAAYDFIPINAAGAGFHIVYSHRDAAATSPANNVGIYLIELDPAANGDSRVLVYGMGYGDLQIATYGAACDARFVDHVIQEELGFLPAMTKLQFVAPHGHVDHINPDLPRRLSNLGYKIGKIRHHPLDEDLVENGGMSECSTAQCPISFQSYANSGAPEIWEMNWAGNGGPAYDECDVDLSSKLHAELDFDNKEFDSPLGTIRFAHVPGHTCGTVDLLIDADPTFLRVLGSNIVCAPPSWVTQPLLYGNRLTAHGNIALPNVFGLPGCGD